jgi:hypothetical protein
MAITSGLSQKFLPLGPRQSLSSSSEFLCEKISKRNYLVLLKTRKNMRKK